MEDSENATNTSSRMGTISATRYRLMYDAHYYQRRGAFRALEKRLLQYNPFRVEWITLSVSSAQTQILRDSSFKNMPDLTARL